MLSSTNVSSDNSCSDSDSSFFDDSRSENSSCTTTKEVPCFWYFQFNGRCKNGINCTFSHDNKLASKLKQFPCLFSKQGGECTNSQCKFNHPERKSKKNGDKSKKKTSLNSNTNSHNSGMNSDSQKKNQRSSHHKTHKHHSNIENQDPNYQSTSRRDRSRSNHKYKEEAKTQHHKSQKVKNSYQGTNQAHPYHNPYLDQNSTFNPPKTTTSSKPEKIAPKKALIDKYLKIFLMGATGAGKSSFVNLCYVKHRGWIPEDLIQKPDVLIKTKYLGGDGSTERDVTDVSESQTTLAKLWEFVLEDHENGYRYHLSFLDTPGIGDTRGLDQDQGHIDTILNTVSNTSDLNAILLVVNGTDARISDRLNYIMRMLQGMIPDALGDNLFALLTNVSGRPNLDINKTLDVPIPKNRIFYYNNEVFQLSPEDFEDHNLRRGLDHSFQSSMSTLAALMMEVSKCSLKPTNAFKEIKYCRDQLKQKLIACSQAHTNSQRRKLELQDLAKQVASGNMEVADLQKRLTQVYDEDVFETTDTPYHNTTCLSCYNCCHQHCALGEMKDKGNRGFLSCAAFCRGDNLCGRCQHSFESHVHLRVIYNKTTKKVPRVNPLVQQSLLIAQQSNSSKQQTQQTITAESTRLDQELSKHYQDIKKIILDMQKVCSRFNYMKEVEACIKILDEQIDVATSDASRNSNSKDKLKHLASLTETKKKMEQLKQDLSNYLNYAV